MVVLIGEFLGKVAAGHLGLDFIGDQAVDECLGSIPDLYVLRCQPVHRPRSPLLLTERSVYVTVWSL